MIKAVWGADRSERKWFHQETSKNKPTHRKKNSGERSKKRDWIFIELQAKKNTQLFSYQQGGRKIHIFDHNFTNTHRIKEVSIPTSSSHQDGTNKPSFVKFGQVERKLRNFSWILTTTTTSRKINVYYGGHNFVNISPHFNLKLSISLLVPFGEIKPYLKEIRQGKRML